MALQLTGPELQTRLKTSFEETIRQVTKALKAEGFGVVTEIDVRATLRNKLDVDFRKYRILGACNPPLAYQALGLELELGLLLPCNLIAYENDDGESVVVAADPITMLSIVDNPDLEGVAQQARSRLVRVIKKLSENR